MQRTPRTQSLQIKRAMESAIGSARCAQQFQCSTAKSGARVSFFMTFVCVLRALCGKEWIKRIMGKKTEIVVGQTKLTVSNLEKVLYPDVGFTKAQVIDYYIRIAPGAAAAFASSADYA